MMNAFHRVLSAIALLTVFLHAHADGPNLQRKMLLGGKVSVLMPDTFSPMSPEMILKKYPRGSPPGTVYSNEATTINVAFEHTNFALKEADLVPAVAQARKYMQETLPSSTFFRDEITRINGKPFVILDVRTPAPDYNVRNIVAWTTLDDRALVITFNVIQPLEEQWLPTGNRIIDSITLNPEGNQR